MVSQTPFDEVLSEHVYENLEDGLQDGYLHGLDTADYDESVLLWGPPGAGKTTESVGRLAAYAEANDLDPRDVTVVTYRTSLAANIKNRIREWDLFPFVEPETAEEDPYEYMGTGHAVSCRASGFLDSINDEDDRQSKHAGMVDDAAKAAFCAEFGIWFKTGKPWVKSQWEVFHDLYTFCKQNLLDVGTWRHIPEDELLGTVKTNQIAYRMLQEFHEKWGRNASFERAVKTWEAWKAEHDCHDYYEQLEAGFAAPLPATEFVIIDEIHDAYPLMTRVFEEWIEAAGVAVIAGDPDQVCNAFSGAHPSIFTGLNERVDTELPTLKLPKSHRVPDEHFQAAAQILSRHRTPPELETAGPGDLYRHDPAGTLTYADGDGWLPLHPEDPASPLRLFEEYGPDMMFEARTQMMVDGIGACLDAGGVIYRSQDGVAGNWSRRLDVLDALKAVENVRPARQAGISNTDSFGSDGSGRSVTPTASNTRLSTQKARVILQHSDERHLAVSRSDALEDISWEEMKNNHTVGLEELDAWVETTWWSVYGQGREAIENLVYVDDPHGFTGNRERDVTALKRSWDRYDGEFPDLHDVETKLWTLHAAKGDESLHAVVFTGVTGRVRDGVREDEEQAANESRTWYVGLTRARKGLHIVRDAFDVTCDNFRVIPNDLEHEAIAAANDRQAERRDADEGTGGEPA